jgi:glycosyltransferase involved in cell wall biosynthesis
MPDRTDQVTISVLTSTYQRVGTLPRLYRSLCEQSFEDFEWVIVDDGSDDGSEPLIRGWIEAAPFPIVYHWQENRGTGTGRNRAIELARGRFCSIIDSDDWYLPHALERMLATWETIPAERREGFANVEGLRVDIEGGLVVERFPADVFDTTHFELRALHGIVGDTIGMYRREVLAANLSPEDLGWHATPAIAWNRISRDHSTRFVNEIWAGTDYQPGGLSSNEPRLRLEFREAPLVYWREYAAMPRPMRVRNRFRANVNYLRYSLLCGVGPRRLIRDVPDWRWAPLAFLPALVFFGRDRLEVRRNRVRDRR